MRQFRLLAITSIALAGPSLLAALLVTAVGSGLIAQTTTPDRGDRAIVERLFPAELLKDSDTGFGKEDCFARLDSTTIVAAYSYSLSAAIVLLKDDGQGQYRRAFKVSGLDLIGDRCHVNPVQLWDDAHALTPGQRPQQVIVGFSIRINSIEWAFDVVDDKLVSINPASSEVGDNGEIEPTLSDYGLVNYYHDGTMQMISGGEYPPPADGSGPDKGMDLYRIVDHKLVLDPSVDVIMAMTVSSSSRSGEHYDFLKPIHRSGPFILRMVNGDWHGENRVHSAFVSLNGKVVASFNQADDIVEINVPLKEGNNVIAVEAAPEGSQQMTLAIVQKIAPTTSAQ